MSFQSTWLSVLLLACIALALVYGRDHEFYDNKEVAEKRPFFVGSRYGRSSNGPRQVVPRNDRFFLGSRYGKRSTGEAEDGFPAIKITTPEVTCLYTGVLNLYKCFGNVQPSEGEE